MIISQKDVEIVYAFDSGEMHNGFVMCRRYGMTMEFLAEEYKRLSSLTDFVEIRKLAKAHDKKVQESLSRMMEIIKSRQKSSEKDVS